MTTKDYIREFNKRIKIVEGRKWMLPIVSTSLSEQSRRLYQDGKNGSNVGIGTYSEAYKKRRQKKGLPSSKVVLRFTNKLQSDFNNSIIKTKLGFATGVKAKDNGDKVGWLADLYGKVLWLLTKKEKAEYRKRVKSAVTKILS